MQAQRVRVLELILVLVLAQVRVQVMERVLLRLPVMVIVLVVALVVVPGLGMWLPMLRSARRRVWKLMRAVAWVRLRQWRSV